MNKKQNSSKNLISPHFLPVPRIRLSLLLLFCLGIILLFWRFSPVPSLITGGLILLGYLLVLFVLLPPYYRRYACFVGEKSLLIRKGLLIERRITIDYQKIQYCIISQGFFQKRFRVCSVWILMAGTFEIIRHVSAKDAHHIRRLIRSHIAEQEGSHD